MQIAPTHSARLGVALCALVASFTGTAASAGPGASGAYSVLAGPKYSTSRTLASTHRLDCTTSNPYIGASACSLHIDTGSAGCIWEKQSTGTGAPAPSACRMVISGPVPFRKLPAYCYLGSTEDTLAVTYTVGSFPGSVIGPFRFYAKAQLTPTAFNANATATRRYSMKITAAAAPTTATGQDLWFGSSDFAEVFTVDFSYPVKDICPNVDGAQYSVGNVMDARSDVVAQDNAPTGFVQVSSIL